MAAVSVHPRTILTALVAILAVTEASRSVRDNASWVTRRTVARKLQQNALSNLVGNGGIPTPCAPSQQQLQYQRQLSCVDVDCSINFLGMQADSISNILWKHCICFGICDCCGRRNLRVSQPLSFQNSEGIPRHVHGRSVRLLCSPSIPAMPVAPPPPPTAEATASAVASALGSGQAKAAASVRISPACSTPRMLFCFRV